MLKKTDDLAHDFSGLEHGQELRDLHMLSLQFSIAPNITLMPVALLAFQVSSRADHFTGEDRQIALRIHSRLLDLMDERVPVDEDGHRPGQEIASEIMYNFPRLAQTAVASGNKDYMQGAAFFLNSTHITADQPQDHAQAGAYWKVINGLADICALEALKALYYSGGVSQGTSDRLISDNHHVDAMEPLISPAAKSSRR